LAQDRAWRHYLAIVAAAPFLTASPSYAADDPTDYQSCVYNILQREQACLRWAAENNKPDAGCKGVALGANYQICYRKFVETDAEKAAELDGTFKPPTYDINGKPEADQTNRNEPGDPNLDTMPTGDNQADTPADTPTADQSDTSPDSSSSDSTPGPQ
jgi:hypothetical protein